MELISKEQIKKDDEKEYILELNLNAIRPKINFGKVNINTPVERTLLIKNVQNKQIKINVNNKELDINNLKLCINKQEHTPLKIKWQPKEAQNLNCSIRFEVTNATRLNFIVKVVGVCVGLEAPVIKKHKYNPSMYAYIYESNDEEDQTETRLKNNEEFDYALIKDFNKYEDKSFLWNENVPKLMISKLDPIMNQSLYNEATISTLSSEPSGLEVKANPKTFRQESKLEAMMNRSLHDEAANSTLTSEPFGQEFKENLETSSKESKLITIMNQSLNNEAANTTLTSEPSCLEFKLLTKIYQRKNIFEERRQSIEKIQKDMNDEKKDQILRLIDEKTQLKIMINFENNREKLIQKKIFQEINKYTSLVQKNESQILNLENEMKRKNNLAKNNNSKLDKMPCLCSTRISEDIRAINSDSFKNNQKELYHIKNGTNNVINLEGVVNGNIFAFIRSIASKFQKPKKPSADIIPKTSKPCIIKRTHLKKSKKLINLNDF